MTNMDVAASRHGDDGPISGDDASGLRAFCSRIGGLSAKLGFNEAMAEVALREISEELGAKTSMVVGPPEDGLRRLIAAPGVVSRAERETVTAWMESAERLLTDTGDAQIPIVLHAGADTQVWIQPIGRGSAGIDEALLVILSTSIPLSGWGRSVLAVAAMVFTIALASGRLNDTVSQDAERFRQVVGSLPGVVYQRMVKPDGDIRYTYISDSAEQLFGVPAKRILEDPRALFNSYSAEYAAQFRERLLKASRDLSVWDVEASVLMPDGTKKYTHAIAHPQKLEDGSVLWTGVILDASRIKKAEREAAETEARTRRAIVESLPDGFLLFDSQGGLALANRRFFECYPDLEEILSLGSSYRDVVMAELQYEIHETRSTEGLTARATDRIAMHNRREPFSIERRISGDRWLHISECPTEENETVIIYHDITELRKREQRMQHMALHDAMTELPNRVLFRERLLHVLEEAQRYGGRVAVLCIDLDNFKHVNDTLGHPAGDMLLRQASKRILGCIRDTDTLARLGGDEFAVIVPGVTGVDLTDNMARRIIESVGKPFQIEGQCAAVGASIGISISEDSDIDADILIKNADLALYRAKSDLKNCHRFFTEEMDEKAQARRMLELELRQAIINEELVLHFQPQVYSDDEAIKGFEALVRWQHPEKGLIEPAGFIDMAEETGLVVALGDYVLRHACEVAAAWDEDFMIAVNVSPAQLRRAEFLEVVTQTLRETALDPKRLELEITETVFLRDTAENIAMLYELKKLGVRIAMDDFGTGYSTLGNLRRFPFDKIKIDHTFVKDLSASPEADAIIRAVLDLGNGLAIDTTAEGVETLAQVERLRSEGCSQLQGFYYSRPIPQSELHAFIGGSKKRHVMPQTSALSSEDGPPG